MRRLRQYHKVNIITGNNILVGIPTDETLIVSDFYLLAEPLLQIRQRTDHTVLEQVTYRDKLHALG
jgi:hypothetical protein